MEVAFPVPIMPSICENCGGEEFDDNGACVRCDVVLRTFIDHVVEEEFEGEEGGPGLRTQARVIGNRSGRSHKSWMYYEEGLQIILRAQCEVLVKGFGCPDILIDLVGSLWFHYLAIPDGIRKRRGELVMLSKSMRRKEHKERRDEGKLPLRDRNPDQLPPSVQRRLQGLFSKKRGLSENSRAKPSTGPSEKAPQHDPEADISSDTSPDIDSDSDSSDSSSSNSDAALDAMIGIKSEEKDPFSSDQDTSDSSSSSSSASQGSANIQDEADIQAIIDAAKQPKRKLKDAKQLRRGMHYTKIHVRHSTIELNLAIIMLAILYLRLPILPQDLLRLAQNDEIPYFSAYLLLPETMLNRRELQPTRVLAFKELMTLTMALLENMALEVRFPPILLETPLLARMATLLDLPSTIERAAYRLCLTSHYWASQKHFKFNSYAILASYFIVALKVLYSFRDEDTHREKLVSYENVHPRSLVAWLEQKYKQEASFVVPAPWTLDELSAFHLSQFDAWLNCLDRQRPFAPKNHDHIALEKLFTSEPLPAAPELQPTLVQSLPNDKSNPKKRTESTDASDSDSEDEIKPSILRRAPLPSNVDDFYETLETHRQAMPPVTMKPKFPPEPSINAQKRIYPMFGTTPYGDMGHPHDFLLQLVSTRLSIPLPDLTDALKLLEHDFFGKRGFLAHNFNIVSADLPPY